MYSTGNILLHYRVLSALKVMRWNAVCVWGTITNIYLASQEKNILLYILRVHRAHQEAGGADGSITKNKILFYILRLHHVNQGTGRKISGTKSRGVDVEHREAKTIS